MFQFDFYSDIYGEKKIEFFRGCVNSLNMTWFFARLHYNDFFKKNWTKKSQYFILNFFLIILLDDAKIQTIFKLNFKHLFPRHFILLSFVPQVNFLASATSMKNEGEKKEIHKITILKSLLVVPHHHKV